jgi:hypothetical protein
MPNLNIPFNRTLDIKGGGIVITDNADVTLYTVTVASNLAQTEINIDMNAEGIVLDESSTYKFVIPGGIVEDAVTRQGNPGSTEIYNTPAAAAVVSRYPTDDAITYIPGETFSITFDTTSLTKGSGDIRIYRTSDDLLMDTINISSATLVSDTLSFNTTALSSNVGYYIQHDASILYRTTDNIRIEPITDKTTWNFTTDALNIVTLDPADNAVEIIPYGTTATITYGYNITVQTGDIRIYETVGDVLFQTIDVTTLTPSGANLPFTINNLNSGVEYYILADANIVISSAGAEPDAITDKTFWSFTTDTLDVAAFDPADNSNTAVPFGTTATITYVDNITVQTGNITIYETVGDVLFQTIDVTTLTPSGADLPFTINNMDSGVSYYILTDEDIVISANGKESDAITDKTVWNFTTDTLDVAAFDPVDEGLIIDSQNEVVTITYEENITVQTGDIRVYETVGDVLVKTIDVTTLTPSGADLSFNIGPLTNDALHYILADADIVIGNTSGKKSVAITAGQWDFRAPNGLYAQFTSQNTVDTCEIFHNASVDIDSGSGFVTYAGSGTASFVPSTTSITLRGTPGSVATEIRLESDTFLNANLNDADNLTNLSNFANNNTLLLTFAANNTSNIGLMVNAFNNTSLGSFPLIDTSNVVSFDRAWQGCNFSTFPLIDTSAASQFDSAWKDCSNLTSFPAIDTSNATNLRQAWQDCSGITSFPALNTANVTNFQDTWEGCSSMTSIGAMNVSSGQNFDRTFQSCSSLTSMPDLNTIAGTSFTSMFNGCTNLVCLTGIDTTGASSFPISGMFSNCTSLTAPTAGEQTSLTTTPGLNYTNAGSCP